MAHATVDSSVETSKQDKKSASENVACKSMDHSSASAEAQPLPPDGGWGYVVVFASFLIHVITDGVTYSFGVFYVELLHYFEEGRGATAWIASILVGVTLCSGPISGWFVNKYGCRSVTIAGSILASMCLFASNWATHIVMLYFTVGIGAGLGFGLIYLPAIVSVSCYFEKYRSLATGIAVCGSGLGTLVFAPCIEYLIAAYGWRGAIMICSGIVLNCIVLGALFRPLEPTKKRKRRSPEDSYPKVAQEFSTSLNNAEEIPQFHTVNFKREYNSVNVTSALSQPVLNSNCVPCQNSLENIYKDSRLAPRYTEEIIRTDTPITSLPNNAENSKTINKKFKNSIEGKSDIYERMLNTLVLKDPLFILFTVSNFCTSIGFYVPYVYVIPQAEEQGINSKDASYLLAVIGIANTVGRILLGYMSDKPWINRLLVYTLCIIISGVATILSTLCTSFVSFALYSSVFGFTSGAYVGLTSVILVDLFGLNNLTNAFGLLLLFQGFASLLGPPIAGWLYDALKSYDPGFFTAGGMIAISGLMLVVIPFMGRKTLENVNNEKQRTTINDGSV